MNRLMLNGNQLVSGEPTLKLECLRTLHSSMHITSSAIGTGQWVTMALPLCIGNIINKVTVYYQNSNSRSCIVGVAIMEQTNPDAATEPFSDSTHLTSTTPTSHVSNVPNVTVNGSMLLSFQLDFTNTTDIIKIGAIEIDYN